MDWKSYIITDPEIMHGGERTVPGPAYPSE